MHGWIEAVDFKRFPQPYREEASEWPKLLFFAGALARACVPPRGLVSHLKFNITLTTNTHSLSLS